MKNNILEYSSKFRILKNGKISLVVCGMLAASGAYANPTGGSVASGGATIGGTATNMTVSQTTANAIINWNTFNVAGSESVAFTGGNATLNRISDANPSTIAGTVTGDHALFFVNPNGIVVSGMMTAPTLVLSTLGITDTDFNAGHYNFTRGTATGKIVNSGTIGDGGQTGNIGVAALFAANVTNTGTLQSNNVAIVAADAVTLGATTSAIDVSSNYDVAANGSTGVSAITAATVATSIFNDGSNEGYIGAEGNGVDAGNIDIYSTKGSITNTADVASFSWNDNAGALTLKASGDITNNGSIYSFSWYGNAGAVSVESTAGSVNNNSRIYSRSFNGNSGDVSVQAYNDVQNFNGTIASQAYDGAGKSAGAVSVTATNGMIDNGEGTIQSYSASGASDTVTLQAKGDINNLYGGVSSRAYGTSANSGAVSLTSDTGSVNNYDTSIYSYSRYGSSGDVTVQAAKNIDNSNSGSIYSQAGNSAGAVSLSATTGTIDLSNGGEVYSSGGTAGAVSISAPHLLFTSDEMNSLYYGQSRSYIYGNGIALNVDTINALDATQLDPGMVDNVVWSTVPTVNPLSDVSQGMVLGTPAALPTDGTVASGSATIDAVDNLMTITQDSANAIINWSDFSVAYGNTVNFLGGTATLNRVTTSNPSVIAGTVTGDHALFFINPNGIINTGSITAPTLVLSTLAMSDANFNAGTYSFTGGNNGGSIINYGLLGDNGAADNTGVAALFAPKITNTGEISAHNVALVAADTVTLGTTAGYSGVSGMGATTAATSIANNGASIYATDTGSGSGNIDIYSKNGDIQNHGGTIEAYSSSNGSGDITVHASGDIQNYSGSIDTYSNAGGKAGSVRVTSDNGNIDNSEASIYSQTSAYNRDGTDLAGGDAGDVSVVASNGKINNNYGSIYSETDAYAGSTWNGTVYIGGSATSGTTGTVTVNAKSDISNMNGSVYTYSNARTYYNTASSGDAGAVSVTSSNGAVNNFNGEIFSDSYSYGSTNGNTGIGDAGAVSVSGYTGVNNYDSSIYSEGANAGKITVTSSAGSIDNSDWGSIYSYAYSGSSGDVSLLAKTGINNSNGGEIYSEGSTQSGNILVSTTGGSLDITNGGQIYSTNYSTGVIGDVTVYAPEVSYTENGQDASASYIVSEGYDGTNYTHGKININANTINGTPIASATLASTDDATKNWDVDGNTYNFFGTVATGDLKSTTYTLDSTAKIHTGSVDLATLYGSDSAAIFGSILSNMVLGTDYTYTVDGVAATTASATGSHEIGIKMLGSDWATINTGSTLGNLTIAAIPTPPAPTELAPAPTTAALQQIQNLIGAVSTPFISAGSIANPMQTPSGNGATTVPTTGAEFTSGQAFAQNDTNQAPNMDYAPEFPGQVRFTVGYDITHGRQAMAHSTIIPGIFVIE